MPQILRGSFLNTLFRVIIGAHVYDQAPHASLW